MDGARLGKIRERELVRVGARVGEVEPQREVYGRAVPAAGEEEGVEDAKLVCNLDRPSEEDVGDDAEGKGIHGGDEAVEGGLEGPRGFA